jgi:porin
MRSPNTWTRVAILFAVSWAGRLPALAEDPADEPQAAASQPPAAAPAPTDFWTQDSLTGSWGGARSRWKEHGFDVNFSFSQFAQGVASGGIQTGAVGNGKFQTDFKFDLGKLAGWQFWTVDAKTETRFEGPLLSGAGAINPVNTTALIPGASGNVFAITSLNATKLIPIDLKKGELFAISFGRYNLLDLIDEKFFGGSGIDRFFNLAQIGPLTVARQVPIITNLVSFAWVRGGEPFLTLAIMDPNNHATDPGLSDLFADGVTFSPGINVPVKYFGKKAKHSLSGAVTTKAYTPFSAIPWLILPGPPINPITPHRGSFSVGYTFRQYLVERPKDGGWGFFGQVSFADRGTSPVTTFVNVGIGGSGLFASRLQDEFGVAYAYTDLSESLKNNLAPFGNRRLQAEHQVEMFYNFHLTPWLRLTPDLQIIRPARPIGSTAVVPGIRLEAIL